jgi:hypothetical protein
MHGKTLQDEVDEIGKAVGMTMDDETPPEERDPEVISPRQRRALEVFAAGGSLGDAATAAGVTRRTLHRWRVRYPEFGEAMSSWEAAVTRIAKSHIAGMVVRAAGALSNAIDKDDARSAIIVLRSMGVIKSYTPSKPPTESKYQTPDYYPERVDDEDEEAPALDPLRNYTPPEEYESVPEEQEGATPSAADPIAPDGPMPDGSGTDLEHGRDAADASGKIDVAGRPWRGDGSDHPSVVADGAMDGDGLAPGQASSGSGDQAKGVAC